MPSDSIFGYSLLNMIGQSHLDFLSANSTPISANFFGRLALIREVYSGSPALLQTSVKPDRVGA